MVCSFADRIRGSQKLQHISNDREDTMREILNNPVQPFSRCAFIFPEQGHTRPEYTTQHKRAAQQKGISIPKESQEQGGIIFHVL